MLGQERGAHQLPPLCLGLYPAAHSFSRGEGTQRGELPCTLARPQLGPREEDSIQHPRCAPTGKIIQHLCASRFFPRKGTRGGCSPARWCTCQGHDQDSPAATGATGKPVAAEHTGRSAGSAASLPRGVQPRKGSPL